MTGMTTPTSDPAGTESGARLEVEVWSDLVCPWCYLGRARFESALSAFPHRDNVEVTHRSFELDPGTPRGTTSTLAEWLATRYGDRADAVRAGEQRLAEMAAELGLPYRVDRLHGNTRDAHRLIQLGVDRGVADDLVPRLFRANFAEARSIFEPAALIEIAAEAGLDPVEAGDVLEGTAYAERVRADEQLAAEIGINGVPFFVLDRAYGISGAQPAATFSTVLERVWQERQVEGSARS